MLNPSSTHGYVDSESIYSKATPLSPIENVIKEFDADNKLASKEKLIFCYRAVSKTLHAYFEGTFTSFDAQTTTTCCHGISLLVHNLIEEVSQTDVIKILSDLDKALEQLEKINVIHLSDLIFFHQYCLPEPIIRLTQIYLLSVIKEKDEIRGGWRTVVQKLKEISPIGSKLAGDLTKKLQTFFSNLVADSYQEYLTEIDRDFVINTIPTKLWEKYVRGKHIKVDRRGRKYASSLYSMQITLAYLIQQRIKIAVVNDLKSEEGIFKGRYIQLLEGDGHSNFNLIDIEDVIPSKFNGKKPVIVFSGCTHSNHIDKKILKDQLNPWFYRFPSLVLACDTNHPQYPIVRDDHTFDSSQIEPQELVLKNLLSKYKETPGVSPQDPSLYCLTHIYTASLDQIIQEVKEGRTCLFESFIPTSVRS